MKKALIFGISGQDGGYLAQLLLARGYTVFGASRDAQVNKFTNLKRLDVFDKVQLSSVNLTDFRGVLECLQQTKPDEIYNFSGQSSVGLSFEQPRETFDSILGGTINLLESIRFLKLPIKFYNSCSSECFGDVAGAADEQTPFRPKSPYGVAKAAAFWAVNNYRQGYGMFASSGILYNHESPLRPERFVTQKIVTTAVRISRGSKEKLKVGDIKIKRDWGWAPEFVEGIYRILQHNQPDDFILATGKNHSLEEFIQKTFSELKLNWKDHVTVNAEENIRPSEIRENSGNPAKAEKVLGWRTEVGFDQIIQRMIQGCQ